ncbi:MAG TPA: glycoside hydrolase family 95 protein [Candidatus Aminicenantes bacterium]|nr:glycoside hydrolase family 95 protein [Candidatus Aminicenantes bacterium]
MALFLCAAAGAASLVPARAEPARDPATTVWAPGPADKWENAHPVGNGRLGAMVFGRTDEERIQLNEDTYWTGGPYTTTVKGGAEALPEVRRLVFEGRLKQAHVLFGRRLMGYPIEQQKYQSLGNLVLGFPDAGEIADYRHELDLDAAVDATSYTAGGVRYTRQVFASPVDQVLVVRIAADRPGRVSLRAQLRGERNEAHSNYATDYFRMDGAPPDGLVLRGKSADYLGIEGRLRYEARLKGLPEGGAMMVGEDELVITGADAVTLLVAAATNFVSYKDVSGDPAARVSASIDGAAGKPFEALLEAHLREHRRLFRRVEISLPSGPASDLPTAERIKAFDGTNDPALAGLVLQFGRYLLISSSRPGTQPANLQGLWNDKMNPPWDSKYTTNINTEMNYWPAEVGNLAECAEPLFRMIRELSDQGSDVAREHYGARGWVFHQNTDLWRVAAPMDGPSWGAFTTGGAWLATHLWEHYLFTGDKSFLKDAYPLLKGSAEFFLDFLVPHPTYGWLVTNPSTSPENFPSVPGQKPFFDEITTFLTTTTICAGSTIDTRILSELFADVAEAARVLGVDEELRRRVIEARAKLAPMRIGRKGNLQEWLEDWDETEKSHRHISGLWGLFPGREISKRHIGGAVPAAKVVLEQRGLTGNGWSSAWKAACWARLGDAARALENLRYAMNNYTTASLFSICANALQVDGALGFSAAVAEMLLQSQNGEIEFLPALPDVWRKGEVRGLRARGGFEIGLKWLNGRLSRATILSTIGGPCRIRIPARMHVTSLNEPIYGSAPDSGVIEFKTDPGRTYVVSRVQ